jgi:hypothetical protein
VLVPETEHAPFDIVAWKNGQFKTVRVKYREATSGKLNIKFSICWTDKNGTHTVSIDKSLVDIYCIFCPDTNECHYLKPSDFGNSTTLRVSAPKNNQIKGINLASDYREVP